MCAVAPVHVVIPAGAVVGSTLRPDGSVEVYGAEAQPFPSHLIIGESQVEGRLELDGGVDEANGQKQWLIGADGRLLSKTALEAPLDDVQRSVYAVSPDGNWFVGLKSATAAGAQGSIVVWRRGSSEVIPVGVSAEQTGGPMVRGVSNDGDVIYMAYVGEDLRGFAWDRMDGLVALKSLYAVQGNGSPQAALIQVEAISADGRTIVGRSGSGADFPMRATLWVNGVAHALPMGDHTHSYALSVSDDGRVIGGSVGDGGAAGAAVWVDRVLQSLTFAPNTYDFGPVSQVVSGGGDPNAWAAVGWMGQWLARSDGVARSLSSYLPEQYGLSLLGSNRPLEMLVSDDALYLVTFEMPSSMCAGFNCYTSGKIAAHLLVLPHHYSHSESDQLDLSGDHLVSPIDVLIVINAINEDPSAPLFSRPELRLATPKIDVNGDGELTAADALQVINAINEPAAIGAAADAVSSGEGESPEGDSGQDLLALAADEFYRELAAPRRGRAAR